MPTDRDNDSITLRHALAIARLNYQVKEIAFETQVTPQTISNFLNGSRISPQTFANLQEWARDNGYLPQSSVRESPSQYRTDTHGPLARLGAEFRHLSDLTLDTYLSDKEKIKEIRARLRGFLAHLDTYEKHIEKTDT